MGFTEQPGGGDGVAVGEFDAGQTLVCQRDRPDIPEPTGGFEATSV